MQVERVPRGRATLNDTEVEKPEIGKIGRHFLGFTRQLVVGNDDLDRVTAILPGQGRQAVPQRLATIDDRKDDGDIWPVALARAGHSADLRQRPARAEPVAGDLARPPGDREGHEERQ